MSIVGALPNTISNGQSIDAVPVMNNFNWLMNQVNSNAAGLTQANTFSQVQSGVPATGLANFPTASQIINQNLIWCGTATGTDTISITSIIAPSAYSAGQVFRFLSAGANTTPSVTLNVDGLGAKSVLKPNGGSLNIGDIPANAAVEVQYTGTVFHVLSPITPGLGVTTPGTAEASKALILDPNKNISGLGKVGVGTNVRAWSGMGGSIDVGAKSAFTEDSSGNIQMVSNAYWDGTNWRYMSTGTAAIYEVIAAGGDLFGYAAPSGTAGTTITFTEQLHIGSVATPAFTYKSNTVRHDGNTFHGRVQSTGTAIRLPAGWSSSKSGTGWYAITHSLGTLNYTVVPAAYNGPLTGFTSWAIANSGVFYIYTFNTAGASADAQFSFEMFLD